MQHLRAMFCRAFSDQQSIGLSVESIDSFHRHFLSRNNKGFCKQLSSYTKVAIFSSKHWAGLSPFLVALSILRVAALKSFEVSSSKKMPSSEWKRIQRGVPPFGLILKLQHWRFGNVFKLSSSLSTWFCTWMNLPNVARYGREMSNVHQCHPRAVKRLWMVFWFFVISDSVINVAI